MKNAQRIFLALMVIGMLACFRSPARAADSVVSVSTYGITDAAHIAAEISGAARVEKFVFSNSSSTASSLTVYANCASTTTAIAVLAVALPPVSVNGGNVELDYSAVVVNNPFKYTDMCFRKPSDAADTYVKASTHYR